MGLTIVVGKKGSGKTAFALGMIERELERPDGRMVLTNMAIYKDKLEAYFRAKGKEVNVADRLVLFEPKDMRFRRWWRCRGENEVWGAFGIDSKWDECRGILFVLDEGQKYFSARGWTERQGTRDGDGVPIGVEAEDYLCQERKTGDDTIVTTPSSSLLDKQFRTLSTECVVLDNWYKKKIRGVRPPGRFQAAVYENCPPGPGEEPIGRPHFYLDTEGLMACYNTAAGAGFVGARADKDAPAKGGVPLWVLICGLPLAGLALWFGMHLGVKGVVNRYFKKTAALATLPAAPVQSALPVAVSLSNRLDSVAGYTNSRSVAVRPWRPLDSVVLGVPGVTPGEPWGDIIGLCHGSSGWSVVWSDGLVTDAVDVRRSGPGRWIVDGRECRQVLPKRSAPVASDKGGGRAGADKSAKRI